MQTFSRDYLPYCTSDTMSYQYVPYCVGLLKQEHKRLLSATDSRIATVPSVVPYNSEASSDVDGWNPFGSSNVDSSSIVDSGDQDLRLARMDIYDCLSNKCLREYKAIGITNKVDFREQCLAGKSSAGIPNTITYDDGKDVICRSALTPSGCKTWTPQEEKCVNRS